MSIKKKQFKPENELLPIILHDIQSPLRFIGTIMQELQLHSKNMETELIQEHVIMVNDSVSALQKYCNTISAWIKLKNLNSNCGQFNNLNELFIDVGAVYSPLIKFKNVQFKIIESNFFYKIEKEILFTILLNILDNAYKNTNRGKIILKAVKENEKIKIIISDTGIGMSKQKISDLLNDNNQINQSSLGYFVITDLLKKINGKIEIESKINIGTTVTISLLNLEKYGNAFQDS